VASVGTLAWAGETGGALRARDRVRLAVDSLRFLLELLPVRTRRRAGLDRESLAGVELPDRPPDSRAAREAEEHCRELSSESLFNHCLRTYVWAALLGRRDRLDWDDELLYVACLLHDLGITPAHDGREPGVHCFAVEGARAADAFLAGSGWEEPRRDRVAEAICLHNNPQVPSSRGIEAHLLSRGAGYDVVGRSFRSVPVDLRERELARHPRLGFTAEMERHMREQARKRPRSRPAFFIRYGGFGGMIARAPFAD
jgi:hypothetical protein